MFVLLMLHHTLWYSVLVCHQKEVCKNHIGSVYVGGYSGLSEIVSSRSACS